MSTKVKKTRLYILDPETHENIHDEEYKSKVRVMECAIKVTEIFPQ